MPNELSQEYLLLFNAITDTVNQLESINLQLMAAQQNAEQIYLERTE